MWCINNSSFFLMFDFCHISTGIWCTTHTNKMFNNGNSRNKQKAHPWCVACRRRLVNATRKMSRKAHKTEKFYIFLKKITTVNTSEYMCKYPIFKYHFTYMYSYVCIFLCICSFSAARNLYLLKEKPQYLKMFNGPYFQHEYYIRCICDEEIMYRYTSKCG